LCPPPVHGEYMVSLTHPDAEQIETARLRFNCYAESGALP
jgi:hypothetical protein